MFHTDFHTFGIFFLILKMLCQIIHILSGGVTALLLVSLVKTKE